MSRKYFSLVCVVASVAFAALVMSGIPAMAGMIDVSDALNVLPGSGRTVTVSSLAESTEADLIDNLAADNDGDGPFKFGGNDSDQRISISGFNSGFSTVRIYMVPADTQRLLGTITLRSSTALVSSLTADDYETVLGTSIAAGRTYLPYITGVSATDRGYFDMTVSAPSGTQSLFIDAGATTAPQYNGARIYEVQALIPEPGTIVMVITGLIGLLAYAWRKRK